MKRAFTAYPYLVWAVIFILAPLVLVAYYGLTVPGPDGGVVFSLENFGKFFTSPIFLAAFWRSIWTAALATIICLLIGYPVAYFLSGTIFKNKSLLLLLLVIPMWMNLLLRTYAWLILLDNAGLVNTVLNFFGIGSVEFLYHEYSIVFGMVYNFLPFMILPIHSVLVKMDHSLIEAAQDLGANKTKVFFKITFPMSLPGIFSGITMVFMPAVTTFAISDILSGRTIQLMGNLIENQFLRSDNWNFGSTMSIILMALILLSMVVSSRYEKDNEGGGLF